MPQTNRRDFLKTAAATSAALAASSSLFAADAPAPSTPASVPPSVFGIQESSSSPHAAAAIAATEAMAKKRPALRMEATILGKRGLPRAIIGRGHGRATEAIRECDGNVHSNRLDEWVGKAHRRNRRQDRPLPPATPRM